PEAAPPAPPGGGLCLQRLPVPPGPAEAFDRVGEHGPHQRAFTLAGATELGVQGVAVEVELDDAPRRLVRGMMSPMVRWRSRQGPAEGIGLACLLLGRP